MNPGDSPLDYTPRTQPLGPAAYVPPASSPVSPMPYTLPIAPVAPPAASKRLSTAAIVWIGVGTLLSLALIAGGLFWANTKAGVSLPGAPATFTAAGEFTIVGDCTSWGYSDIGTGTQVVITDDSGKTVGVGELNRDGSCAWHFAVPNVPAGGRFYGVTVSRRGTIQYTESQLRSGVQLSLGG